MSKPTPELAAALARILDRIDRSVLDSGYGGPPITMYLAGGLAVDYYCGSRYTEDVDASFSRRILLRAEELKNAYRRADGKNAVLYFDANYNTTFALMHPDFENDSAPWEGIGNERRIVKLNVLSAVDLAVSKIARSSGPDVEDIRALALERLITEKAVRARAEEALGYYIGNLAEVRLSIEKACLDIAVAAQDGSPKPRTPGIEPTP
ncbi:MAG: DUF6036 family nucleotidyltransferase [Opitutaceae bacterium]